MSDYIKLAETLDELKLNDDSLLEKLASLYLMYSYSKCNGNILTTPGLAKIASDMHDEDTLALHLGIEMVLSDLEKQEV